MKYCIYLSLLLICISLNAQTNDRKNLQEIDSIFSLKLTGETFIEKKYKGDPFVNKDWVKSDMLLSTGERIYGKMIKYNGLLDEVIWLNPFNFGKFILDKSYISDFWFKNDQGGSTHFKRINVSDLSLNHQPVIFVEIAVEGKISIFIQRRIRVFGSDSFYEDAKLYSVDLIEPSPLYYIKLPTNQLLMMTGIRLNSFLKVFPVQKKSILKSLKNNHLKFKSESDLIKAVDTLNKEVFLN